MHAAISLIRYIYLGHKEKMEDICLFVPEVKLYQGKKLTKAEYRH